MKATVPKVKFIDFLALFVTAVVLYMNFYILGLTKEQQEAAIVTQMVTIGNGLVTLILAYYFGSSLKKGQKPEDAPEITQVNVTQENN